MPAPLLIAAAAAVETIVVTGQPLPLGPGSEPFAAITRDAEALVVASGRPEDALRLVGGMQLFRRASTRTANPTAEGLTARGLSGNAASRMTVTLDGIPLADPFFGSVAWTALAARPIAFARIERGAADPAAGLGGVAGSVALESALAPTSLDLRGGTRASSDAALLARVPVADGALSIAARHSAGDGHLLVNPALAGPADRAARYRQRGANIRAVLPLGADTELQALFAAFSDHRLRGAEAARIAASGGDLGLRLVHRGPWQAEAAAWGQLRDFQTRIVTLADDRASAAVTLDQQATPASGAGARLELRPPVPQPLSLRFGADARTAGGESRERFRFIAGRPTRERRAGGRQHSMGAFAEAAASQGALSATLGGRIDGWWLRHGRTGEVDLDSGRPRLALAAPDRHGTEWSGRAGIAWQPAGAFTLSANAGRAVRLPTLNELHRPFRVGNQFTDANAALQPERATSLGATVRYEPLPAIRLSLTGFQAHLANAIANVTLGQGPGIFPNVGFLPAGGIYRQRRNLPAIHSRGLEADAAIAIGRWQLLASGALTDARVRGAAVAPDLSGRRPAQAPRLSGSLSATYLAGAAQLRADLRHAGAQYEDDRNERRLAPATTLDAMLDVPLGRGLTLNASAENLLDASIETGVSGSLPELGQPRTLWLGLRWAGR